MRRHPVEIVKGSKLSTHPLEKKATPYRELTFLSVAFGIMQGIVLNLAFVYAALKLGFSLAGSTVASILGYAVLKGVFKKGTMAENNINQTIASGINTAGTGVVFTLPALLMLQAKGGADVEMSILPFILAGIAGAFLGVVLIIPLRKQMIDLDRLMFPSGVAVATVIRSGGTGFKKAKLLFAGFAVSGLVKLVVSSRWATVPGILENEVFYFGLGFIPEYFSPALNLSLMIFAAGMLSGKFGLAFPLGGLVAWFVVSPASVWLSWTPGNLDSHAQSIYVYANMLRPLGTGALVGAALMGVFLSKNAIISALVALSKAGKRVNNSQAEEYIRDEMPISVLIVGAAGSFLLLFLAAYLAPGVTLPEALMASLVGTIWLFLAGIIVAQATGMTDLSPMSGMAMISVGLMMFLLNNNVHAAMVIGISVSVAIGMSTDMMQDLKTGYLIGARPYLQQLAQLSVAWIGPILAVFAVYMLWTSGENGTGGFGPGSDLPAPQAGALMGIMEAVSSGNVPVDKYVTGGILGAILTMLPVAGFGVLFGLGLYLPLSITFGFGFGCLAHIYILKRKGKTFFETKMIPFCSGLIVGEALVGIASAAYEIFLVSA